MEVRDGSRQIDNAAIVDHVGHLKGRCGVRMGERMRVGIDTIVAG